MDRYILLGIAGCFGLFTVSFAQQAGYAGGSGYGGGASAYGAGGSSYVQGTGVYFKKPVPIDEKPIFFRTPYWLPNMYYGHYGYPWTQWFDGGPRYVIPIMNAYPHGGGGTQSYNQGYGNYGNVGAAGYSGSGGNQAYGSDASNYGSASSYGGGYYTTPEPDSSTTDPYNDNFSYYKGIPIYQTYYEKYLLQQAQAASTTAASATT